MYFILYLSSKRIKILIIISKIENFSHENFKQITKSVHIITWFGHRVFLDPSINLFYQNEQRNLCFYIPNTWKKYIYKQKIKNYNS